MTTLEKLAKFLVAAKKNTYASERSIEIPPERPLHKELEYFDGEFYYRDSYIGFFQALGMEEVRLQNREGPTIWTMAYSGGMLPEFQDDIEYAKRVFNNCLKPALKLVSQEFPFRGPSFYRSESDSNLIYIHKIKGDIRRFKLDETIFDISKSAEVFSQDCIGGLVVRK